jgi:hypothetical protein
MGSYIKKDIPEGMAFRRHGKVGWNPVGTAPSKFLCRSIPGGLPYRRNRRPGM